MPQWDMLETYKDAFETSWNDQIVLEIFKMFQDVRKWPKMF